MYLEHFGLCETPFGLTPDTSFFFACSSYQEALNTFDTPEARRGWLMWTWGIAALTLSLLGTSRGLLR